MNTELDKRLSHSKAVDPNRFTLEVDLQKTFKLAVDKACRTNCEGGTVRGIVYKKCLNEAFRFRPLQAVRVNERRMKIRDVSQE